MKLYVCGQCSAIVVDNHKHGLSHSTFGKFSELHLTNYEDAGIICRTTIKQNERVTIAKNPLVEEQDT